MHPMDSNMNTVHPTEGMIGGGPIDIRKLDNVHTGDPHIYKRVEDHLKTIHQPNGIPYQMKKFDLNIAPKTGWDLYVNPYNDRYGLLTYEDNTKGFRIRLRNPKKSATDFITNHPRNSTSNDKPKSPSSRTSRLRSGNPTSRPTGATCSLSRPAGIARSPPSRSAA